MKLLQLAGVESNLRVYSPQTATTAPPLHLQHNASLITLRLYPALSSSLSVPLIPLPFLLPSRPPLPILPPALLFHHFPPTLPSFPLSSPFTPSSSGLSPSASLRLLSIPSSSPNYLSTFILLWLPSVPSTPHTHTPTLFFLHISSPSETLSLLGMLYLLSPSPAVLVYYLYAASEGFLLFLCPTSAAACHLPAFRYSDATRQKKALSHRKRRDSGMFYIPAGLLLLQRLHSLDTSVREFSVFRHGFWKFLSLISD